MSYSKEYYENRDRFPMWRVEASVACRLVGPAADGAVLELGCGSGELLRMIQPKIGIGIDHNEQAIGLARRQAQNYEFKVADAALPKLAEEFLDCVVSVHFFEHVADPLAALSVWRSALRTGGRMVILTPNADYSHPEEFDDPDHKHIYQGPELQVLLEKNGFTVTQLFTVGLWGVRKVPFLWRFQPYCDQVRLPAVPGLRWRGQTLCASAVKRGAR